MTAQADDHFVRMSPTEALNLLSRLAAAGGGDPQRLVAFLDNMAEHELLVHAAAVDLVEQEALPVLKAMLVQIASARGIT